MAIQYINREVSNLRGGEGTQKIYQIKHKGNKSFDDIVHHIASHNSGLKEGDIINAMQSVVRCMTEYMLDGYSVDIDGLGRFKLVCGLKDSATDADKEQAPTKHNAQSLEVKRIKLTTNRRLLSEINQRCHFERAGESLLRTSKYTLEERRQLALQFLDTHPVMHVEDYARLTGLSKTGASLELKVFRQDPESGITSTGRRASLLYVKA
ncbi:MAG: hypothetical protein IJ528_11150 [Bacteroidaceae bacterium]|nr:hypothetical protein [Bacteroidaceae bacterium]